MPLFEGSDGPGIECATLYTKSDPWANIAVNRNKSSDVQVTGRKIFERENIHDIGVLKIDNDCEIFVSGCAKASLTIFLNW